ncbi:MAG: D-tyrosyl-tRNA(Tyr) deacylase [Desulfobacterales bacterium]|nr:MAG: D-tyrosyl-tRNA(Tyr) deacylase [Desulfobacterales bacterium]
MRAVIQRVKHATVRVEEEIVGEIGAGLLLFLGIAGDDSEKEIKWLAEKAVNLRIFADSDGKMNLSLKESGLAMLIVSQFTLYGDCRKGRRPGFAAAAPPELAKPLYHDFINTVQAMGISVATGRFQTEMAVELVNDGPVTLTLDTDFLKNSITK